MVITPDVTNLSYEFYNGIKYFELTAEPVKREILKDVWIKGWGYNGSIPGPTIQVFPGDLVNVRVFNELPEPTSIHWHGLNVPNIMDGVPEVEHSPRIDPGRYFDYHFKIDNPPGTHMYHTHVMSDSQLMRGLGGAFIILDPAEKALKKDYFYMLQEFKVVGLESGEVTPGIYEIDPMSHEFNFFTLNGRCYPYASPIKVHEGDYVKIRMGNIVENAHPMHLHGHQFMVTASDGNSVKPQNVLVKNTVLVASGETCDVEFLANNPGNWPFHCHIPHHMSNNMTEAFGGMSTVVSY